MIWPWTEITRLRRALVAAKAQRNSWRDIAYAVRDRAGFWREHAGNLVRASAENRRDLRQWERKYARIRRILDPRCLHKEPPAGVRYESRPPGPGCVSLADLAAARMKELADYTEAYGHDVK